VRGGGHGFPGFGTNDGGVVTDLSKLANVEIIDKERHLVRIGGGATWGQVAEALTPHGLAISSGDTKSVGVGGLTLTGGIGWKVRKYGLALDNVAATEVVTADGEVVHASAEENPELFWAIRGGGGNFGIVTAFDFAAHPTTDVFFGKIAFAACGPQIHSVTANRTEFLGEHGSVSRPAALTRLGLSGAAGPGLDPCAAITTEITLAPGEAREVIFALGQADSLQDVRRLISESTQSRPARSQLKQVQEKWDGYLSALQVTTPDPAMDLMLNRWLVYQVLACRVWARSAFYQSGGAYGFRDQLQDVMALVYSAPA